MTDRMIDAGIKAYLSNQGQDPKALVELVWQAMKDAKQKEALEEYWKNYG